MMILLIYNRQNIVNNIDNKFIVLPIIDKIIE